MIGFETSEFNLAIVAILVFFAALLIFTIGRTIYQMLSSRKSEDTGDVDDEVAVKGSANDSGGTEPSPSVGDPDRDEAKPLKSYDTDFDDLDTDGFD